jgi:hypothetical protein
MIAKIEFYLVAFLFISVQVFSQQKKVALQYQLEMIDTKIHVELVYEPLQNDSTKFTYGVVAFGGQIDIFKGLQNIKIEGPARVKIDSVNRAITIYHALIPVKISYDIADTRTVTNTRSQLFRPIILPDYFFIHGLNLFLTPSFRQADLKPLVSVEWKKLPPFPMFYTFDPDNNGSRKTITTVDSISFRFMTGAKDLTIKKFTNESGTNYLVLRSTGIAATTIKEVENFYVMYNRLIREFWRDNRIIKYSLVLQPFLNVNHKMSGVSFGNGFIGKYNKPDSLAKGERKFIVAHEIGHYYLSDLKAFEGEHNEGQWFNEGFNDYQTFFNLIREKNMSPEEFENDFNKIFRQLYNSPIKNTANNKIFENFWKLGDYAKLPYWRGCVYAFYLDNQISVATKGKRSLRDLMLDLKEIIKDRPKKEFTNEEFINTCASYLPREKVAKDFDEFIINGKSISFNSGVVLPLFKVEYRNQTPFLTILNKKKFVAHYQFK